MLDQGLIIGLTHRPDIVPARARDAQKLDIPTSDHARGRGVHSLPEPAVPMLDDGLRSSADYAVSDRPGVILPDDIHSGEVLVGVAYPFAGHDGPGTGQPRKCPSGPARQLAGQDKVYRDQRGEDRY
jgi:hypothetical protein